MIGVQSLLLPIIWIGLYQKVTCQIDRLRPLLPIFPEDSLAFSIASGILTSHEGD